MSLINDALKRATQTQPPGSVPPAITKEPMQPVAAHQAPGLPVYFVPVLLFIVSGACFFLWKGWQTNSQNQMTSNTIVAQAREPVGLPEVAPEENIAIPANRVFSVEDEPAPASAAPAAEAAPVATVAPVEEPAKPAAPSFKLQGIFFRVSNPSAVVNNKTVFIGESIGNARIKAIDRQTVTLEHNGETQVLTLP